MTAPGGEPQGVVRDLGPVTVSRVAVASLAFGILWLGGLGSLLAVTFGWIALAETRDPQRSGRGLAVAGIVLGCVGLLSMLALPFLLTGREDRPVQSTLDARRCRDDLGTLQRAIDKYVADTNSYPPDDLSLQSSGYLGRQEWAYQFSTTASGTEPPTLHLSKLGVSLGCTVQVAPYTAGPTVPVTSPLGNARQIVCTTERQALGLAEQTYQVLRGRYAPVNELLASGTLEEAPTYHVVSVAPDGGSFEVRLSPEGKRQGCTE